MARVQAYVDELNELIGPTLIAFATGSERRDAAHLWIRGTEFPNQEQVRRINFMVTILRLVIDAEGEDVARAWFIGANCDDMTRCPAELLREGNLIEVEVSANHLIKGEFTS